ncbi:hypothetical protein N8Z76_00500 [Gammaproteobacteria bacterium]|nr:hypothetical protein [Gammaproteobacteria bacterium]
MSNDKILRIRIEIKAWIRFAEDQGATDDSHVYAPPVWPTLGTLRAWDEALKETFGQKDLEDNIRVLMRQGDN